MNASFSSSAVSDFVMDLIGPVTNDRLPNFDFHIVRQAQSVGFKPEVIVAFAMAYSIELIAKNITSI